MIWPTRAALQTVRCLAGGVLLPLIAQMLAGPTQAQAQNQDWIGGWTASPQAVWEGGVPLPPNIPVRMNNETIRQVVRVGLGGARTRVVLSNAYGTQPLVIGEVRLATQSANVRQPAGWPVTFGGHPGTTIAPGALVISDPAALPVSDLGLVSVSIFLPQPTALETFHWDGRQTAYIMPGNRTADSAATSDRTVEARIILAGVIVESSGQNGAVVALGDSITDGNGVTVGSNSRWPDYLAARLAPAGIAVLNAGISGARLLQDGMGVSALARFDRDVLSQPHVRTAIVLIGINDISWPGTPFAPGASAPSATQIIAGYRQLIDRAHVNGVRVIGATLTPFEGALSGTPFEGYYTPEKEALRQAVNAWIRTGGAFDGVIDFDALMRDPTHPTRLRPDFDSGDHLHPGDLGNAAMAQGVDLELLLGVDAPSAEAPPSGL